MILLLYILLLVGLVLMAVLSRNETSCYFFEHKDWILWNKIIRNFDNKVFISKSDMVTMYNITIDDVIYKICYWSDDSVAVYLNDKCVLSPYDRYHQEKIKRLFKEELSK